MAATAGHFDVVIKSHSKIRVYVAFILKKLLEGGSVRICASEKVIGSAVTVVEIVKRRVKEEGRCGNGKGEHREMVQTNAIGNEACESGVVKPYIMMLLHMKGKS